MNLQQNVSSVHRLIEGSDTGKRLLVAVAGPPASGKSTLAEALVDTLNGPGAASQRAALLPMDGFHLDNRILDQRGLRARKGAPETFDARGLLHLLKRLKAGSEDAYHPVFDREADIAIANAGFIPKTVPIVVVEGNYLLLQDEPWCDMPAVFDTTVFLSPAIAVLEQRLVERWLAHDHTLEQARARVEGNDLVNARLIVERSGKPDLFLQG